MTWLGRIGLALVRPRTALETAGRREHAGRSGSDLVGLLALLVIAAQLRSLVGAIWLAVAADAGSGIRGVLRVLTQSLTLELAAIGVAGGVLWLLAGARRDLGRAFDLACVAIIPLVVVDNGASIVRGVVDSPVPTWLRWSVIGVGLAWASLLVILGVPVARALDGSPGDLGPPTVPRAVGLVIVTVAAIGVGAHGIWIATHLDWMKPVETGDRAMPIALPRIEPDGSLGGVTSPTPGKVVVLDFWATWCGPCLKALPGLDRLARSWGDGLEVLAINMDDPEAAATWFAQRGFVMTLLADDELTSGRYGVREIPHTVLVDTDGTVLGTYRGNASAIHAAVDKLMHTRGVQIRNYIQK